MNIIVGGPALRWLRSVKDNAALNAAATQVQSELESCDADHDDMICCSALVRFWHKADMARLSSNVCFWG